MGNRALSMANQPTIDYVIAMLLSAFLGGIMGYFFKKKNINDKSSFWVSKFFLILLHILAIVALLRYLLGIMDFRLG